MQGGELAHTRWWNRGLVTLLRKKVGADKLGDTGARKVIQWTSKAWTAFELKLPVFYRESLARLLALEKYRNLIETNITAGITLYADHKAPGLFKNSLSNKGQLSACMLLETVDLLSIVENLYYTGSTNIVAVDSELVSERLGVSFCVFELVTMLIQ